MRYLIELFANAGIIVLLGRVMPHIIIKSYGKAFLAAFLISIVNVLLGWLLRGIFNILTLGLLSSLVSLIVTAVMIKLVDSVMDDFEVKGFWPALVIALAIGFTNYMITVLLY